MRPRTGGAARRSGKMATAQARRDDEVRDLLRAPAAAAVARRQRVPALSRTRSTRSSSRTGSATTTRGRSSTTSSRSTRTPRRRRCSSPRPASAPSASASGTASCSSPRTTRRASPSAWPRSTSSSNGRVELGLGEGSSVTELHPFDRRFRDKREVWEDAVKALLPDVLEGGLGVPRQVLRLPAAQRPAQAAAEAAPAAVGRVLAARHDSHGRARAGWARSASSSCRPRPRRRGCTRTTTRS